MAAHIETGTMAAPRYESRVKLKGVVVIYFGAS